MEKRQFKRISFRKPVQYRIGSDPFLEGTVARDISAGGIKFHSNEFIALDSSLSMNIPLGPDQLLKLDGHVVWLQKFPHAEIYHVGLEFSENNSNIQPKEVLQRYIESLS